MELEILESKKGTKVVTASNLYQALRMPSHSYGANVRKWMRGIYELKDGIRRPEPLRDCAKRPRPNEPIEDFYLTLELAKLIAIRTTSKEKLKIVRYLTAMEANGQLDLFQTAVA